MVLATDISKHFKNLAKFKTIFAHTKVDIDNKFHVLEMLLHASDISNPTRPWKFCKQWAGLILEEFFA